MDHPAGALLDSAGWAFREDGPFGVGLHVVARKEINELRTILRYWRSILSPFVGPSRALMASLPVYICVVVPQGAATSQQHPFATSTETP